MPTRATTPTHPILRAQAAIDDKQPLVAVDLALQALATTRGHRSDPETEQFLNVLGSAVLVASGASSADEGGLLAMFDDRGCDELACAALLRLLALDDDAFAETDMRNAVPLFDRVLSSTVYEPLKLSTKTQAYEKRDALRIAVARNEAALQAHVDGLGSLDALQGFRQNLSKKLNDPLTKAVIRPFLPPVASVQAIGELLAATQSVVDASEEEIVARAEAVIIRCEDLSKATEELPTNYSHSILETLSEKLRILIRDRVRESGLADPAEVSLTETEKRYPLANVGSPLVLRLNVVNGGRGQARDVAVSLEGHQHVAFVDTHRVLGRLGPGRRRIDFPGAVVTASDSDAVMARVSWSDPDGTKREAETIIDLVGQSQAVPWESLEYEDPYPLEPVTSKGAFVGRDRALADLAKIVIGARPGNARIVGQRRVGKTSIALALAERIEELRPGQFSFIYVESGDFNANTPEETIERLGEVLSAKVIASDKRFEMLATPSFESGLSPLTELFDQAHTVSPDKRFILVLDEFDAMPHPELYERGPVATAFFQTMRSLGGKPNVGFVLVGGERMRFVIANHGQALNKFTLIPVDYFDTEHFDDYASLVRQPVEDWLSFDDGAIALLHEETAGNPWTTKLVAREIFARAVANRDADIRAEDVRAALDGVIPKLGATSFQHFWDDAIQGGVDEQEYVSVTRRKVLLGIASCARGGTPLTEVAAVRAARQFGLEEGVALDVLRGFREREILLENAEGRLEPRVPLFFRWLVDEGVNEIIVTMGDDDALIRRQRAREAARPKANEIEQLIERWRTYQGQLISIDHVRRWLNQFGEPPDQRLMLQLLQKLRYFNSGDIAEHVRALHNYVLRDLASQGYQYKLSGRQRFRNDLLVCGLEGAGSGAGHLVKPYRDENRIYADRAVDSGNVPVVLREAEGRVRAVVVLEDFFGTGATARERITGLHGEWTHDEPWPGGVDVYVLAVCGFDKAVASIREHIKNIGWGCHVHVSVPLDERDRCFHDRSEIFPDDEERERARALCFDRGSALDPKYPLGFNDSQAAVSFETRCPNNSLPVLWKNGPSWEALFPRMGRH